MFFPEETAACCAGDLELVYHRVRLERSNGRLSGIAEHASPVFKALKDANRPEVRGIVQMTLDNDHGTDPIARDRQQKLQAWLASVPAGKRVPASALIEEVLTPGKSSSTQAR